MTQAPPISPKAKKTIGLVALGFVAVAVLGWLIGGGPSSSGGGGNSANGAAAGSTSINPGPASTTIALTTTPPPTTRPPTTTHTTPPPPPKTTTTTKKPPPPPPTTPTYFGVHPGAFCSPHWAYGLTSAGTLMQCKPSATDARFRWRQA